MIAKSDQVIGYTTGVYDLFHVGHLRVLKKAKEECDFLIVGVTADDLCESRKGVRPTISLADRMEIVAGTKYVDLVVVQDSMNKMAAWEKHQFNRIFVGDDWKGSDAWNKYEQEFNAVGCDIVYFPYTDHVSSTKLREGLGASKN